LIFTAVSTVGALYLVLWSFQQFDLTSSPLSFFALGHMWSALRYEEGIVEPWPVRLLVMWVYPAALFGGLASAVGAARRRRWLSLSAFFPSILLALVVAARAGVLVAIVCWFAGYLAIASSKFPGGYSVFQSRLVMRFAIIGTASMFFFLIVDSIRGFDGSGPLQIVPEPLRLETYLFGSLAGFGQWLAAGQADPPRFGAYTFAGIFDLMGWSQRYVGLYEDVVTLQSGEPTNIYTAFRGLIQDFTLFGSALLSFTVGLASGYTYSLSCARVTHWLLLLAAFYAFAFFSPLVSVFNFNGVVLAWVVAAMVLPWSSVRGSSRSAFSGNQP
jgi:oligosaccharide repeat unit polymerase